MAGVTDGALPLAASTYYGSQSEVVHFDASDTGVVSITDKSIEVDINFYNRVDDGTAVIYQPSSVVIGGLTSATTYYVIKGDTWQASTGTIKLATTYDNAIEGIDIVFSGTQSSFGSSTELHTLVTTAKSLDSSTWDEDSTYGCVCDSTWTVGLGSGQTQLTEYFGPDCSLRRCPSNDDPITEKQAITAIIHSEDTAYNSVGLDFGASKVLLDDSDSPGNIWLGADGASAWFILTLTSAYNTNRGTHSAPFRVASFEIRNTANNLRWGEPTDLRSTTGYTIELSTDASTWTSVVTGTLTEYEMGLQTVFPTVDMDATYVRFTVTSHAGAGGGLGYFAAFINDDERDCSNIVAPGGFGTGARDNKCHVQCSNRGLCEYTTGECECFPGFIGDDCSVVNVAFIKE
jgi:hypothetical protein